MRLNSESAICWGWRPLPENSSWPEGEKWSLPLLAAKTAACADPLHFAHALTVLARDTYEVGRDGLTDPSRLRCINA